MTKVLLFSIWSEDRFEYQFYKFKLHDAICVKIGLICLIHMPKKSSQVFHTHNNYLSAIKYVASGGYADDTKSALVQLASKILDSGWLSEIKRGGNDFYQIHKSLNNAWGIEALFKMENLLIKEEDLIRLSNNWCLMQTYYIFYYTTQALAVLEGYNKPQTHPQVQRTFLRLWSDKHWILSPWCISFNENGFHNLPPGVSVDDHVHSWKKVDDKTALNLFCKALRTTREEFIVEALTKRRQRHNRKDQVKAVRLTQKQKRQTQVRVRPTTLISYLYRLKRKTTYEQSSILATGPENIYQSAEFRENLGFILDSTLLMTEMITLKTVGDNLFFSWCDEWEKYKAPAMINIGPGSRISLIQ